MYTLRIILIVVNTVLLVGCATTNKFSPQMVGIADAEWQKYNAEKRAQTIANYQEITQANQLEDKEIQRLKKERRSETIETIEVKFSDGVALMPPFTDSWFPFTPVSAVIVAGACQDIWLVKPDGTNQVVVRSCYRNKILSLDASFYDLAKRDGTFNILYSPLWERGFTYRDISSYGHAKLKKVTVNVKQSSIW